MTKTIKSKVLISALFVALLCILLSVVIVLPTSAEELTPTASGSCGENATWEYYESTGELKILGSGAMTNYSSSNAPWYSYRSNIKTVTVAEGITSIGNYAFYYCNSLTNIEIPSSVTSIGFSAFYNCTSLTSIEIPSGVMHIGAYAFYDCCSLTNIELPSSVISIGEDAFYNCKQLMQKANGISYVDKWVVDCDASVANATLCDNIIGIANDAFKYCYSLTSIEIPSSVTVIGTYAFRDCSSLTSVIFGDNSQLVSIGDFAFSGCTSLINIEIPLGVTNIGGGAFYHCDKLIQKENGISYVGKWVVECDTLETSVCFRNNIIGIANHAFDAGCSSLISIEIPSSITSIGYYAFNGCTSLTNVIFGENSQLTIIGEYAFRDCTSLKSIKIPSKVTKIEEHAFYHCYSLTSISILSKEPAMIGENAFYLAPIESIYVPTSAVVAYKSHKDWAEYKDMIFPLEAEKATISFGEYKVKTGKTVSVTVSLENNPGIAIASITLDYDKTALTLKEVENGEIFDTLDWGRNLLWSADANCEGNGVLATLTFEVNENAEAKDYTISARVNEAYNEDSEKVDILISDGKITTYKFIYGDANDDDVISALDVLLLRKYVANYDYTTGISTVSVGLGADANGDGNVTALDVLLMRKYMANYDYDAGTSSIVLGPKE